MTTFEVAPIDWSPIESSPQMLIDEIDRWVSSSAIRSLVNSFGGSDFSGDLDSRLDQLDTFTEMHWDFRNGTERNFDPSTSMSPVQVETVLKSSQALGMLTELRPRHQSYDHLLILGGLVRACILRPSKAAELMRAGLEISEITALGSFRILSDEEQAIANMFGLDGDASEIDVLDFAVRREFSLTSSTSRLGGLVTNEVNSSMLEIQYAYGSKHISVISAPSSEPLLRRANTADTYTFWARNYVNLKRNQRILLVTSAIYSPFQHTDAIRILGVPYSVEVETIGLVPGYTAHGITQRAFGVNSYLQEIRSAIRSMKSLLKYLRSA